MNNKIVRYVITHTIVNNRNGPKTCLLKDKEAYIVATSEIDGKHGLPRDAINVTNDLQRSLNDVGKLSIIN